MTLRLAWTLALCAAALTAVAHLMLKAGAIRARNRHVFRLWTNPWVLMGYATFFAVTLLNLRAFELLPLKLFVVLNSAVLLLVMAGSRIFFGEKFDARAVVGATLVLAGVVVFSLPM